MEIKKLKSSLERIESLFAAAGVASAAKDLHAVVRLLDGHDEKTVEEFIVETNELLNRTTKAKTAAVDEERVTSHAKHLLDAGVDQTAFDVALSELDRDRLAGKAEWATIANHYRNAPTNGTHVYKFKSIKDARSAIRDTFVERSEANNKRSIISRLTNWGP